MTDRDPYPSEKQDRFIVRLPDGMRDRIKAAAEANNRSMNAEIVATLNKAYPRVIHLPVVEYKLSFPAPTIERIDRIMDELKDVKKELTKIDPSTPTDD